MDSVSAEDATSGGPSFSALLFLFSAENLNGTAGLTAC